MGSGLGAPGAGIKRMAVHVETASIRGGWTGTFRVSSCTPFNAGEPLLNATLRRRAESRARTVRGLAKGHRPHERWLKETAIVSRGRATRDAGVVALGLSPTSPRTGVASKRLFVHRTGCAESLP